MALKEFTVAAVVAAMQKAEIEEKTVDKLSTGKLGIAGERAKIEDKPIDLAMVFGEVVGVETGVDKRTGQEWSALKGEFYMIDTHKPEVVYTAGLLFLPAGQAKLEAAVMTGALDNKDRPIYGRIEFAVMIVAVPAKNARGYSWELRNITKIEAPAENSVKARLLAKMAEGTKALAAPAADTAKK